MYRCLILLLAIVSTSNGWDRIVGGENVKIEDFPFIVSIIDSGLYRVGGGNILSSRIVLTTARCFIEGRYYSVIYGSAEIDGGRIIQIERLDIHEGFSLTTVDYDVAIIHLAEDIVFGPNSQPIALAIKSPAAGSNAVVLGWGVTENRIISFVLQKVNVEIVDHSVCKKQHSTSLYQITDRMLCAGANGGDKGVCLFDGGGPLVVNNEVVGIVSWGEGCDVLQFPGVYTDVAYLRQWIDSRINKMF